MPASVVRLSTLLPSENRDLMETADINVSEYSAAREQNDPVLAALRSASPQESMMGKSVFLDSHWMLLKTKTLLSCA